MATGTKKTYQTTIRKKAFQTCAMNENTREPNFQNAKKTELEEVMRDRNHPGKRRNAQKMAILTNKSKIFIKAKVIFSKSCLLGHVCFMICHILRDVHI